MAILRAARVAALNFSLLSLAAQPSASPVRYTEAVTYSFQSELRLPGTVESPLVSVVASDAEGLVEEFPVREGAQLTKGDVLARLRTAHLELDKAAIEAELQEALSRQKLASREYERAKELFEALVIAQDELDAKLYEFNAWEGRDARLKALISRIEDDIERATIRAPFDGVVVSERTEVGQWLGRGDPVAELMSAENLEVRIDVPERYFRNFQVGSKVSIAVTALNGYRSTGVVTAMIPRADPQSRIFPVKVRLENPRGAAPGMLAEAVVPSGQRRPETVVPKDAAVLRGAQRVVYVIGPEGTVRAAPVRLGAAVGDWVAVEGPVKPGDRVVTRGNERLQPGQPVTGQPIDYPLP